MDERTRYRPSRKTIVLALLALSLAVELFAFRVLSRPKQIPLEVLGLQIVNDAGFVEGAPGSAATTVAVQGPGPDALSTTARELAFALPATGVAVETTAANGSAEIGRAHV